jgi:hypothetical protein
MPIDKYAVPLVRSYADFQAKKEKEQHQKAGMHLNAQKEFIVISDDEGDATDSTILDTPSRKRERDSSSAMTTPSPSPMKKPMLM